MRSDSGGERETLAPVIPLFGGPVPRFPEPAPELEPDPGRAPGPDAESEPERGPQPEWSGESTPASHGHASPRPEAAGWHPTWAADRRVSAADDPEASATVEAAEKALLKKLRTRSLSVSEARGVLRDHDLGADGVEQVLASMAEYGYLDDAALAEQLIHAGADRKGQGRQAIAQTLSKRGIPRDVADAALSALPDDDLERALEFARGKARSLRSLDRDTALRRLTGQLARRGYGGSVAMTAARTVLDESPGGSSGVRFR